MSEQVVVDVDGTRFEKIPVTNIVPDPNNPRKVFDAAKLQELARSIAELGQIEPVEVRPVKDSSSYMLVAGERRVRAIELLAAGKVKGYDADPNRTVDAIVKESQDDATSALRQLVENLQREDLDPIEEARGIARLVNDFGIKGKDVAEKIGRNAGHVTKRVKLLELGPLAQKAVSAGDITIDAALEVVKDFGQHPDLIDQAVKNLRWVTDLHRDTATLVRRREQEAKVVATLKELKDKGVEVLKVEAKDGRIPRPKEWVLITEDTWRAGAGVIVVPKVSAHAKEPCRRVLVVTSQHQAPQIQECCAEPARHAAKGESTVKAAKAARNENGSKLSPKDKADRAKTIATNKQRRADQPRRATFINAKILGRVLPLAAAAVCRELIDVYLHSDMAGKRRTFARACDYLGHPIDVAGYGSSKMPAALKAYIDENDANLMRFAFALVLASEEGYDDKSAPHKGGAMAAALDAWGYEFSDQERTDLGVSKAPAAAKAPAKKAPARKAPAAKKATTPA